MGERFGELTGICFCGGLIPSLSHRGTADYPLYNHYMRIETTKMPQNNEVILALQSERLSRLLQILSKWKMMESYHIPLRFRLVFEKARREISRYE